MPDLLPIKLRTSGSAREGRTELELDGVRIRLRAAYVARSDRWYLDLIDLAGVPIVSGLQLVPGVDLLAPYKHLAVPQGALFMVGPPADLVTLDGAAGLRYREVT